MSTSLYDRFEKVPAVVDAHLSLASHFFLSYYIFAWFKVSKGWNWFWQWLVKRSLANQRAHQLQGILPRRDGLSGWIDSYLFGRLVGGRVRLLVVFGGRAPQNQHYFLQAAFGCQVVQGLGYTETSGLWCISSATATPRPSVLSSTSAPPAPAVATAAHHFLCGAPFAQTEVRLVTYNEAVLRPPPVSAGGVASNPTEALASSLRSRSGAKARQSLISSLKLSASSDEDEPPRLCSFYTARPPPCSGQALTEAEIAALGKALPTVLPPDPAFCAAVHGGLGPLAELYVRGPNIPSCILRSRIRRSVTALSIMTAASATTHSSATASSALVTSAGSDSKAVQTLLPTAEEGWYRTGRLFRATASGELWLIGSMASCAKVHSSLSCAGKPTSDESSYYVALDHVEEFYVELCHPFVSQMCIVRTF